MSEPTGKLGEIFDRLNAGAGGSHLHQILNSLIWYLAERETIPVPALERGGEKLEYGKGSTVSADDVRGILASKPATATVVHDLIVKYRKQFQETVADDGDLDDLLTAFSIELREAWGIK